LEGLSEMRFLSTSDHQGSHRLKGFSNVSYRLVYMVSLVSLVNQINKRNNRNQIN
jgi:hypothetical protein